MPLNHVCVLDGSSRTRQFLSSLIRTSLSHAEVLLREDSQDSWQKLALGNGASLDVGLFQSLPTGMKRSDSIKIKANPSSLPFLKRTASRSYWRSIVTSGSSNYQTSKKHHARVFLCFHCIYCPKNCGAVCGLMLPEGHRKLVADGARLETAPSS